VTTDDSAPDEARRLEQLWGGGFGDDYVDRNTTFDHRRPFWDGLLTAVPCRRVLEVGCNVGGNLQWVAEHVPPGGVWGIDVNRKALSLLAERVPDANAVSGPARDLPFRDGWFDLVFTMGVLIHQPEPTLPLVMAEMVRCSKRWLLAGEYYAPATEEVGYRGQEGALFKRDYGRLFLELFPDLQLREKGFLGRDAGWDDVTWWLLEKR
jgi:pseudaminic acid biosynthesis-associated methylase